MFLLQEMQKDFQHIDYEVFVEGCVGLGEKNIVLGRIQMDGRIDSKTF
jgi:hypothetical protein